MTTTRLVRLHFVFAIWTMVWIAGMIAMTLGVELTGDPTWIAAVKRMVLYAIVLLAPVMIALERIGKRLAAGAAAPFVRRKRRRLLALKVNGVCVLIPSAIALDHLSHAGRIDMLFYAVKGLLILAAGANLILLGLNFRDGLRNRTTGMRAMRHRA